VRLTVTGLLIVTLLAGCTGQEPQPLSPLPSPESTESTAAPTCTPDDAAYSLGGADAASGVRVLNIELTNCGDGPITVNGYPRLRLLGEEREELAVTVAHGSSAVATVPKLDVPPTPVVLAPGESAWAGIVWRNLVTDPSVNATTALGLDIALSEQSGWESVPMEHTDQWGATRPITIDLGNTATIGLGPWQRPDAGAGPEHRSSAELAAP
jgi:Protein of unknown function (DUF4232)